MIRQAINMVKLRTFLYGKDRITEDGERPPVRVGVFSSRLDGVPPGPYSYTMLGKAWIRVLAKDKASARGNHRIEILCEGCSSWLPAGRIGQHVDRKDHKSAA